MSDYNLIEAIAAALVNDNVRGKVHEFSTESLAAELIGNPNCFSIARAHLRLLDLGIELDAAQAGIECARQVEKVLIKRIAELERERNEYKTCTSAAYKLAAALTMLPTVDAEESLIERHQAMGLVVQWRRAIDAAGEREGK